MYEVLYIISGLFAANGIPHFIKGITGQQQATPFGQPSGAVANVVWGSVNFVVAWAIWHYAGMHRPLDHTFRFEASFAIGVFVMAVFLANVWSGSGVKAAKTAGVTK